MFLTGWADDRSAPIQRIELKGEGWSRAIDGTQLGRVRRAEADAVVGGSDALHGFWGLADLEAELFAEPDCVATLVLVDGRTADCAVAVQRGPAAELKGRVTRFLTDLRSGEHKLPDDTAHIERVLRPSAPRPPRTVPRHTIESVAIAEGGGLFIVGWINDTADAVAELRVSSGGWRVTLPGDGLARTARDDVQAALEIPRRHAFGFWGFVMDATVAPGGPTCICEVVMESGAVERHELPVRVLFDQIELRNLALTYLAASKYLGNPFLDSVACLEKFLGKQIVDLNVLISRAIASRPHVERFGRQQARRKGSIIVCLYGRPEYLILQNALFAGLPGIEDYEFVYVSNSPELAETLIRDARIASRTYGLDLTLVLLPGNAGFGAANNAAVAFSRSDRPLIVNPDVFPHDRDWAAKHTALIEGLPAQQTRLFGAPLYYDDGSLMHGGMYFDSDTAISIDAARLRQNLTLRVEHYGKGAPPLASAFLASRPVPAVTGAFISADRAWFETLYGFSEEYVLGHYEDADLCLKSIENGIAPWMHDLKLWHLEGKGSVKRQPHHEGASIVNRWLFNRRWAATIVPDMLGPKPAHPSLRPDGAADAIRPVATATTEPVNGIRIRRSQTAKPARKAARAAAHREIVFGAET